MGVQTTLDDKYTRRSGFAYMKGIQALARVMIEQQWRDRGAGHRTAGMISGYRGSPVGAFDHIMDAAKPHLEANSIHFMPGLNEDLAANALWGAQQVTLFPDATVDGVYGMWYGKGPGVDRCGDVFKHGNSSGSAALGGVVCVAGDDHNAESSTIPHQTEDEFASAGMPVVYPAGVKEFVEFGLFAIALSRYSGCWVGFTAETECVESSGVVSLVPAPDAVIPEDHKLPPFGLNNALEDDDRLTPALRLEYHKIPAIHAFARANRIDRIVFENKDARTGIVAAGKTWLDVCEALSRLGIGDEAAACKHGIRLYKVGLTWPLEPTGIREFAAGLETIVVIEEKRSLIERQIKEILYAPHGLLPSVVGKRDENEQVLFQSHNAMTSAHIAEVLARRLGHLLGMKTVSRYTCDVARSQVKAWDANLLDRRPFFCSGCPHNRSTLVPAGSRVLAGIGCHTMAMWMPRETTLMPQMGGEGAGWIGQHRFTREEHVFANLGDGTYSHSGSLAIRAAVAQNVNITYKVLFNDAVAMTGGQRVESGLTVPALARQLLAEGVRRVCVVSKEPEAHAKRGKLPSAAELYPRDDLMDVQRSLRNTRGVTALVYDQTCAAQLRRRRKRGTIDDPALRAFINHRVCEGCGDCSRASNCISVEPMETEFGRKRKVNQASCNKDLTCTDGFCPSFVLVSGGDIQRESPGQGAFAADIAALPEPAPQAEEANLLICGTGGTGVITLGAILGVAAVIDAKFTLGLDQTGLAQKGGTTASHVRIFKSDHNLAAARVPIAGADTLIGCDLVVAASREMLDRVQCNHTEIVLNDHLAPVADFVEDNATPMDAEALYERIEATAGKGKTVRFNTNRVSQRVFGDTIYANIILLGFALQRGRIPLSVAAVRRSIELNGVDIEQNLGAFDFGRLVAVQPHLLEDIDPIESKQTFRPLDEFIEFLAAELAAYQNSSYASRFTQLLKHARLLLNGTDVDNPESLLRVIAENAYKLMAYKDEYEVARLYTDGSFKRQLEKAFRGNYKLEFMFSLPWSRNRDRGFKSRLGPWTINVLKLLAALRGLRGSVFDPFGYSPQRRYERQLIEAYEKLTVQTLDEVTGDNLQQAVAILSFPQDIKGYGHVKTRSIADMRARFAKAWTAYTDAPLFQL